MMDSNAVRKNQPIHMIYFLCAKKAFFPGFSSKYVREFAVD